jgi:hypothetical protein
VYVFEIETPWPEKRFHWLIAAVIETLLDLTFPLATS